MANQDSKINGMNLEQQVALLTQKVAMLQATIRANTGNPNLPIAGNYNTYIGARYVPKFADPFQWSATEQYEPLTIVSYQGNTFTSRTFPPVGVAPTNNTYWAQTGNYNAQLEAYKQQVDNLAQEVQQNETSFTQQIEDIKNQAYQKANKKYILIGDSFAYQINQNIKTKLLLTEGEDVWSSYENGGGFWNGNNSFLNQFNTILETIPTGTQINTILFVGGTNDCRADLGSDYTGIVQQTLNTVRSAFPDADIYIAFTCTKYRSQDYLQLVHKQLPYLQYMLVNGASYSRAKVITGLNEILTNLYQNVSDDFVHPTPVGYNILTAYILNAIQGNKSPQFTSIYYQSVDKVLESGNIKISVVFKQSGTVSNVILPRQTISTTQTTLTQGRWFPETNQGFLDMPAYPLDMMYKIVNLLKNGTEYIPVLMTLDRTYGFRFASITQAVEDIESLMIPEDVIFSFTLV